MLSGTTQPHPVPHERRFLLVALWEPPLGNRDDDSYRHVANRLYDINHTNRG